MMSAQFSTTSQNALLLGSAVVLVTFIIIRWRQGQTKAPGWRKVGEISELFLYPLKSAKGIELREAECTEYGLKSTSAAPVELQNLKDRCLIVYEADNCDFVTCRKFPSLLLVKVTNGGDGTFILDAPNMSPLKLKLPDQASAPKANKIRMWFGEEVEGVDCGNEAAKWIRTYLNKVGSSMRIGWYNTQNTEKRSANLPPWDKFSKHFTRMKTEYTGAFSDLASYMLLSEASLNDLKSKLPPHLQSIPAKQFRPNIVVKGTKAYEEDTWDLIKIGDNVVIQGFKPCTRCSVTTLDPDTGIREPKMEPLRTMKTYRQVTHPTAKELEGDAPVMGLYAGLHTSGIIKIGDPVYVNI